MKNTVIESLLRNMALCLATGVVLSACGGSDAQGPVTNETKLLADGEACNAAWVSTTAYTGGNAVSYGGRNYTAAYWTQNNNPSTNSGPAGSGQPWIPGFLCGGTTTTTKATTTTTKAATTTTATGTTTTTKAITTTTKAGTTTTAATTTTTKATTTTTKAGGSCPAYVAGTSYTVGQTVTNAGGYYTCKVAGWCSGGASAYEPGVGWANGDAWSVASASACTGGTTTTTAAGTTTTTKAATTTTGTGTTTTTKATTTTTGTSTGREVGGYFAQWGVYGRSYEIADIHTSGAAAKMTFLNYAFGNVYAKNGGYECDMVTHAEVGNDTPTSPDAGNGGDAFADYQRTPARTVDGAAVPWDAPLNGSFLQIKKLKAAHPNLKVLISLGGWSWSKNFSKASSTDALRKQMVASCVKQFIKGDLPVQDGRGGVNAAAGVFDGIDIDYEYPGGGGQPYNTFDTVNDKHNFTLLMAEFRKQLDAQGTTDGGKHYLLTAAVGAGVDKIAQTEPNLYSASMDWVNAMTYDFHGGWETSTNFHSALYHDPADPSTGNVAKYNSNDGIQALIAAGMPKSKLNLGIPFYGRGWTGVPAGSGGNGVYQTATGKAPGTYEAGIEDYKVLKNKAGTRVVHPVTKQLYLYTGAGGEWWSYDDTAVIATKVQYVKDQGLKGAFTWELDGDANGELGAAVWLVH